MPIFRYICSPWGADLVACQTNSCWTDFYRGFLYTVVHRTFLKNEDHLIDWLCSGSHKSVRDKAAGRTGKSLQEPIQLRAEAQLAPLPRSCGWKVLHRGSNRQFFPQNFCQNSAYFWEFLPKILRKILRQKARNHDILDKKARKCNIRDKKMRNCSINRFTTQIIASVKGKAWFFD